MTTFQTHIEKALADANLQSALDANAERRIIARQNAYASLPEELQVMRQRAHQIRLETIQRLDEYLDQFCQNARRNGLIVHYASDAKEALAIILDICSSHQAKRIAKSKSMVSEEIGLNTALEKAGISVVETDLGEYIVQIRNEPPAHIITPAVHLRRADVGKTFQEKLGLPYTEDVAQLTSFARSILRQVFLEADIGISGVNLAVAESGTLCLLTNEGNGRMVTTLPKVHIALLGIERLVPNFDGLADLLALLPRSATGQKITVYTSLIRSPRENGEADGCLERHVVLVDNGRRAMRSSPLSEALLCIRCGACMNACPVFRELGGHAYVSTRGKHTPYPGPIGSVISSPLFGYEDYGHLARASSLCGACREACPVDIDLPSLLLRVRSGLVNAENQPPEQPNPPFFLRLGLQVFSLIASNPRLYSLAQKALRLGTSFGFPAGDWLHLPAWSGWGKDKDFPRPAAKTFQTMWKSHTFPALPRMSHTMIPPQAPPITLVSPESQAKPWTNRAERFQTEVQALGGEVVSCDQENLISKLSEKAFGLNLPYLALTPQIQEYLGDRIKELPLPIHTYTQPDPNQPAALTAAVAGCVETGSILLLSSPNSPMSASLLPEIHLALLHEDNLYDSLKDILHHPGIPSASCAVLVSGPSRTADIEMTLTIGVHGPKRLVIFLLSDKQ